MANSEKEQWTPSKGLVKATRTLAIRALITAIVWGVLLWLLTPWFNTLETTGTIQGGKWIGVLVLPAVAVGAFMAWRLVEAAGFCGWPVTALGVIFTLAAVLGGTYAAGLLRPLGQSQTIGVLLVMCALPVGWVSWKTLMES